MRTTVVAIVFAAAASSASTQVLQPEYDLGQLRLQQENAQRRAIDQQNQLMSLEARLRADQAALDLQRIPPRAPELRYEPRKRIGSAATSRFPSIPDSVLADSNRRVQEAARNRR